MPIDTTADRPPAFGCHQPSPAASALIRLCHALPANGLGRRLALILRRLVLSTAGAMLDARVRGLTLRVHLKDNVSERKFLFMPQFFDVKEFALIERELPGDGVFLDIGANAGIYSLWAASHLGPQGRVLAIEPNPVMVERLVTNAAFNPFGARIETAACAITDLKGTIRLNIDASNLGGSSVVESHAQGIDVPCLPLLDLLAEKGIGRIDILKIDVEGAEDQALVPFLDHADAGLLPRFVIIERSGPRWRVNVVERLRQRGYTLHDESRMNHILRRTDA
ncbi:MAG TPA: FkbM family methyltransferase [Azospirillaceae bacterium]|nr:FkbM family methyltransferase [Azospirillaceae bacterium]